MDKKVVEVFSSKGFFCIYQHSKTHAHPTLSHAHPHKSIFCEQDATATVRSSLSRNEVSPVLATHVVSKTRRYLRSINVQEYEG